MKIAFVGTHGTGKTTLAYSITGELKKQGKNATMITEVARKCPLPINEKGTLNSQLWILSAQLAEELEAEHKFSHVVCDRSVLDGYCYGINSFGENEMLRKMVEYWIKSYDILFKVPISYNLINDGFRSTDREFQLKIDRIISEVTKRMKISFIELPTENQETFILEKIKEFEMKGQQKLSNYSS